MADTGRTITIFSGGAVVRRAGARLLFSNSVLAILARAVPLLTGKC